jgi:DNA-binding NarL/FixJ family response regulator
MITSKIRILVVDDHFMVRLGLVGALSKEPDFKVVGEAGTGREALVLFEKFRPTITLMDGMLPDIPGVEVARRIVAAHPDARVIMVSINDTAEDVNRAMEAGIKGYLSKSGERHALMEAVRVVACGGTYLPPELERKLAERNKYTPLSDREMDVLRLVAQGKANKEIAEILELGEGTVKTHLSHLLAKLGAPDRTRAVTLAIERGLLRI